MILKALSEAIGISTYEDDVRKLIIQHIKDHVDSVHIDAIGNLLTTKSGADAENSPRLLLAAHMDEVGFMVSGFDNDGLIKFTNIGGIDARILPALRVKVGTKHIQGVIIWTPTHLNRDQKTVSIKNLRIDIGAKDKEQVKGNVSLGDPIAFDSQFMEIGEQVLRGKAFDDRAGCAALVDVIQGEAFPGDMIAAFTVQEEVGTRGSKVIARKWKPDVAIILECTPVHDVPDPLEDPDNPNDYNPSAHLGDGPVLTVMDRTMIANPKLLNFAKTVAEDLGIPYQLKMRRGGGTDAGSVQLTNGGVPSLVVSVPARYVHSPAALMRRDDYENTVKLVRAIAQRITLEDVRW